jgi:hypothetical protein
MSHHSASSGQAPQPEDLCAYVDGELEAPARQAVEVWLRDHPDAATEVEAQRRLADLWQQGAPPALGPAESKAALQGIESALHRRARSLARGRRVLLRSAIAGLAAAVLLVVVWSKQPAPTPELPAPGSLTEQFPVVGPEDVEVQRLRQNADAGLVGAEPLPDQPLPLATPRDLTLINLTPDDSGNIPVLARDRDPNAPALLRPFELVPMSFSTRIVADSR